MVDEDSFLMIYSAIYIKDSKNYGGNTFLDGHF